MIVVKKLFFPFFFLFIKVKFLIIVVKSAFFFFFLFFSVKFVIFFFPGLKFATYEGVHGLLEPKSSPYRARFVAGAVAGAAASLLLYPLDVIKSKVKKYIV
jgi:hypothetical protein